MVENTPTVTEAPEDKAKAHEARLVRLEAFSHTIMELRKAAISYRSQSGIEDQWSEDDEHYESIDATNRTTTARVKPYDFGGTGTGPTRLPEKNANRSTVFVPMTRPYVDIAAARISDMYMPTDDRNWDGEPTPIPELVKALDDNTPVPPPPPGIQQAPGQGLMTQAMQGAGMGAQPPQPVAAPMPAAAPQVNPQAAVAMPTAPGQNQPAPASAIEPAKPKTVADQAQAIIHEAEERWKKARTQIDDWLTESAYNAELRKVIHDMARIGTGILKGPFPQAKTAKAVRRTPQGFAIEIEQKIVPGSKRIDPWRFFPDPACGEDVNTGSHVFEQDFINRSKLRDLKKGELGYIPSQIDVCLEEGPINATTGTKKSQKNNRNEADLFEIWYFEGQVEWQDMQDAGCDCAGQKGDVFHATVTMVNDRVVKAALAHLDTGGFTYDVSIWQRKSGLWIGDGVGRQGRTAQQGLNAAVRNLMDNAGQSSRPHKVVNRAAIMPGADPWTWLMRGDADVKDVSHAMMFFSVPSMQAELMNIIQYYKQMFEDSTGLPMLLQGQQGAAPETVGGMEMLQNNAGIVPRNIVRTLDDRITEPHIGRYYEYLLIHGEDDSAKGDFNLHARGSSALMERASQDQFLLQIAQFVMNPAYGLDPELYIDELLKSKRINPDRLKLSDEKKKELANRPPPEDPRITAAKIAVAGRTQVEQLQAKEAADHAVAAAHLAMNQQAFDMQENAKDRAMQMAIQMITEKMQSADLTAAEQSALNKIKSDLAQTSMKLSVTKDLALADHTSELHRHHNPSPVMAPVIEPAGRADNGQSFAQ